MELPKVALKGLIKCRLDGKTDRQRQRERERTEREQREIEKDTDKYLENKIANHVPFKKSNLQHSSGS